VFVQREILNSFNWRGFSCAAVRKSALKIRIDRLAFGSIKMCMGRPTGFETGRHDDVATPYKLLSHLPPTRRQLLATRLQEIT